ncbi:hypothetical protein BGX29_002326 [Mortierella sp. GBA35]|nr:hypothetical protein BGX29_002326 [Mortierella sp. GBA35]
MSDEPRRKRKWDTQGEEDATAATKKALVEQGGHSNGTEILSEGQDGATDAPQSAAEASAAAAAAIAAAKLNAMLVAKGQAPATSTLDSNINNDGPSAPVAPIAVGSDGAPTALPAPTGTGRSGPAAKERDEFYKDIDINDVKHRYILTKGSVQTQIQRDTTADVTTRGKYYSDRSMATESDPPLYLHVTAVTQEALDLAIQKIDELINEAQNPAALPPQRDSFGPPPRMSGGPPRHQPFPFQTRVEIGMDSERTFNVRAKIVGPGGQYVKHVQNETRTRVKLKGYGSGYQEVETGRESDEPLYISILGNSQEDVDEAERLCKDLVETVRAEYERMKSRPPAPYEPYGGHRSGHYGGRPSYYGNGDRGDRGDRGDSYHRHHHYDRDRRYHDSHHRQPYHHQQQTHHHYGGYNQHYHSGPPPAHGMAPPVNPPLPPGPPPAPSEQPAPPVPPAPSAAPEAGAVVTSESGASASAGAPGADQAYAYDYEAYNQYYYQQQQQYYQQYGQYYQQAYAQPGAEQAAGSSTAAAPVSSDPALAYYGYAYAAAPAPPGSEAPGTSAPAPPAAATGESALAPPPPPGVPSSLGSQPPPPHPEASA